MSLPRMRTIKQTVEFFRTSDPGTGVTEWLIRVLCREEKIRYINVGKKILLDLDGLISYLDKGAVKGSDSIDL